MKIGILVYCAALLVSDSSHGGELSTNDLTQPPPHRWAYIQYPWDLPNCPTFMIGWPSGGSPDESSRGLRMDIMHIRQGFAFFKTNAISARLYRADGQIVEPTALGKGLLNAPGSISTFSMPGKEPDLQVLTYFPWGPNVLQESWIEITIAPERYWVEVPYGIDRNPADPLAPANTNGPPRFVPEMNSLNEHDHVVRWENVHYVLGHTTDGSELRLYQSNPFNAKCDVDICFSRQSPNVYSPQTEARLLESDGTVVTGRCVNIHLDDSYPGRTDTFDLFYYGGGALRRWVKIEIRVAGEIYTVTMPSSLCQNCHGHAGEPAAV
ncbi:MAG TPA: hypothetical protein VGJ73_15305, partial [Verrucomicrobiae bacterium]